ncbi:MAG: glgA [Chlamydiia bacterium]|nr:glgA [Chlamydiia bacterium]
MYVVQIASEAAPVAKVGGLADVIMGLSAELTRKGHDVVTLIPKYNCLTGTFQIQEILPHFSSYFQGSLHDNSSWQAAINKDFTLTFLDSHHSKRFFQRGAIYGFPDDIDRFLYFSRACLDYLSQSSRTPDIIHIHDWQMGALALLLQEENFKKRFPKTRVILTIHNMEYQGRSAESHLDEIGYTGERKEIRHADTKDINLLKAGILFSDAVTTVSPTYAKEVLTEEGAKGLLDVMLKSKDKFSGILNGLDVNYWNPETDPLIPYHYSAANCESKEKNKWQLYSELGMQRRDDMPLLVSITRLVPQKGVELIRHALERSLELGLQFILLGSAPDPRIQDEFLELSHTYASHPTVRILLQNDEALAHKLFAASDLFIIPSIFEPCGLTQMIAMRYGSVPIVRKTGGLADTVFDVELSGRPFHETNGFTFDAPTKAGIDSALTRAFLLWKTNQKSWQELMTQGMKTDCSWNKPSEKYVELYKSFSI